MIMENLPTRLGHFADVGCGLGYSLDFVEQVLNVPAVGFEPNPMSMVSSLRGTLLPVPLDQAWLLKNPRRFDLLLASEVIEHVDDPVSFAAVFRAAMSDELSLTVFSTPDADSITPEESPSETYSRLFPGEHLHLFTADSLRTVLLRAGFESAEITRRGGHLIATAGTASALRQRRHLTAPSETWSDAYQRYLRTAFDGLPGLNRPFDAKERKGLAPPSSSPILAGQAYRLLKVLVNEGNPEPARRWRDQENPLSTWIDKNGLIRPSVIALALSLDDFDNYVAQVPSFLGAMAYHLAMLARLEGRLTVAKQGLQQALQLMLHERQIGPFFLVESSSLLGPARMELALLTFSLGQEEEALNQWQTMDQDLPSIFSYARAAARLLLEANARARYPLVERILKILASHPLRSQGLMQALVEAKYETCPPSEFDLVFDVWIARFYSALLGLQSLSKAEEAYVALRLHAGLHPNPTRQAKLDSVFRDLAKRRRNTRVGPSETPTLVHFVDQLWCDLHGVFVKGWLHAGDHEVHAVFLSCAGVRERAILHPRPDVVKHYPQYPRSGDAGFSVYLRCPPFQPIELQADIGLSTPLKTGLEVPAHLRAADTQPTASLQCSDTFRDMMKRRGGTVVILGGRLGPDHPDSWADCLLPECRLVRVDIHPGPGVDLVADAHALSQHFAPGSVDAVISAYVMEHLEAPWLVAAEINKVLRPGGLTMHHVPHAWPLHAAPNDFWRMSDAGLRSLFGAATGFEVLQAGMDTPTRMYPPPHVRDTRYPSIEMPVFDGYLIAYLMAQKVADLPANSVCWPGTAGERIQRAQTYPVGT